MKYVWKYVWLMIGALYITIMYEKGVSNVVIGLPILFAAMIIADAIEDVECKLRDIERRLEKKDD